MYVAGIYGYSQEELEQYCQQLEAAGHVVHMACGGPTLTRDGHPIGKPTSLVQYSINDPYGLPQEGEEVITLSHIAPIPLRDRYAALYVLFIVRGYESCGAVCPQDMPFGYPLTRHFS